MTLPDFLLTHKGISKTLLKDKFNKDQQDILVKDVSGATYDISLLFQCISLLRTNVSPDPHKKNAVKYTEPADDLHNCLKDIRDFRNELMHVLAVSPISMSDFNQRIEEMRQLLTKTLKAAGGVYNVDPKQVMQRIQDVNHEVSSIRNDDLSPMDVTNYKQFKRLMNLLLTTGKPELLKMYDRLSCLNPLSFMGGAEVFIKVNIVFTRLLLVQGGPSSISSNQCIAYENIIDLAHNTASQFGNSVELILIEGVAGAGKTTLFTFVLSDWMTCTSSMRGLQDYHLLLYMECRNSYISSFAQLLKVLMPETAKKYKDEDMVTCLLRLKILILVDGLDELNEASTKLFSEILQIQDICGITVICSTRPAAVEDFKKMISGQQQYVHIKVQGIHSSSHAEFAGKYHDELIKLGKSTQSTQELQHYLEDCPSSFKAQLIWPLHIVLIIMLWAFSPNIVNTVTTATELYVQNLKMTMEKLKKRLKDNVQSKSYGVAEVSRKIDSFFTQLCYTSLVCLKNDEIVLRPEVTKELTDSCSSLGLPPEEVISAFLVQKISWSPSGNMSSLSFPHKSIQDFYSSLCILDSLDGKYDNTDIQKILHGFEQTLESCKINVSMQKRIRETNNTVLKQMLLSPSSQSILGVLQELHKDNPQSFRKGKFRNTLVHLAGVLHQNERVVEESTAQELVKLLKDAGMNERKDWLELMTDVRCDKTVCQHIAQQVPEAITGDIQITDSCVAAYISLLPLVAPDKVTVVITDHPHKIFHLEPMLTVLSQHVACDVNILMQKDFHQPKTCNTPLDAAFQRVFQW